MDVADNSFFVVHESIEQSAFADISFTDDSHRDSLTYGNTGLKRIDEFFDVEMDFHCQRKKLRTIGEFHIMLTEIQLQFDE